MTDKPEMHDFEVAFELPDAIDSITIRAAYYQNGTVGLEEFIIFKNDEARVVFTIPKRCLGYIRRLSTRSVLEAEKKLNEVQKRIVKHQQEDTDDLIRAQRELAKAESINVKDPLEV